MSRRIRSAAAAPAFARLFLVCCACFVFVVFVVFAAGLGRPPGREVAITFDDLPAVSVVGAGAAVSGPRQDAAWAAMTGRLTATLFRSGAPVVGFVNSDKLLRDGAAVPARVDLLRRWLDSGFELGNHTASHVDRHSTPLPQFEEDVVRGEPLVRAVLEERASGRKDGVRRLRWFRHPYLHTGRTLEEKRALEEFLASRGYRIAPVTIDNSDWVYARAYSNAMDSGDAALARRVAGAYVPYMESVFEYYERQSQALFGREIRQILLVHANSLNAERFGALLERLARRGYSFVSLDRALEDPAYGSRDEFVGRGGITWLHRWVLSSGGKPVPGEPQPDAFVFAAAGVEP